MIAGSENPALVPGFFGRSVAGCFVHAGLLAGKPAPTVVVGGMGFCVQHNPCGSWLASDGGRNVAEDQ
ncbi:hypothetical protein V5O39_13370 [Pseudomonas parakoreensis]